MSTWVDIDVNIENVPSEVYTEMCKSVVFKYHGVGLDRDEYGGVALTLHDGSSHSAWSEIHDEIQSFCSHHSLVGYGTFSDDESSDDEVFYGNAFQLKMQEYDAATAALEGAKARLELSGKDITEAEVARWRVERS